MKTFLKVTAVAFLIALIWGYRIYSVFKTAPFSVNPRTVIINIPDNMPTEKIAKRLRRKNVISSALLFKVMAIIKKKTTKLKSGEYEIKRNLSPEKIMDMLVKGEVRHHYFTFPEGTRLEEMAEILAEGGLVSKEEFLNIARDREFIQSLGIDSISLEGYLFPDTYTFTKRTGERFIMRTMVKKLKSVISPEYELKMKSLGMNLHQTLTLASMIEKETYLDDEKNLVSAVFFNRLNKGMLLQCDPTIIYALKKFSTSLSRKDLSYDSPYNTYRYPGLPPGPICNPGEKSIKAALSPSNASYLFFVVSGDGKHKFSRTYSEHLNAVNGYRLSKKLNSNGSL